LILIFGSEKGQFGVLRTGFWRLIALAIDREKAVFRFPKSPFAAQKVRFK